MKLKGSVPNCIHEGWKYVIGTFFPQQGYDNTLEHLILKFNMYNPNYEMELWVPVVKDKN